MSITIINEPYDIALSRNQVIYKMMCNNVYADDDVFPTLTLLFNSKARQGDGFRFQINDPVSGLPIFFQFSARTATDPEGWYYTDDTHPGALAAYVSSVYYRLLANTLLLSHFDLSYDGDATITFTAKIAKASAAPYNYSEINYNTGVPTDHVDGTVAAETLQKSKRKNYRVLVDVYFETVYNSGKFEKIASLKDEPNADGTVLFDISSTLNAELKNSYATPPVPDLDYNFWKLADNARRYYISYTEYFDTQSVDVLWVDDTIKRVKSGGVSIEDFAKQDPFKNLKPTGRFLTWQPNGKKLKDHQSDWLSWINYMNVAIECLAILKIYYDDGTTHTEEWADDIFLQIWEEALIPVGYNQLGINSYFPDKTAYKWEISMIDSEEELISEVRTFYRSFDADIMDREFIYLNSYCVPESFLTHGKWTENVKIEKQFANRGLTHNYELINGQEYQWDSSAKNNYVVETGYDSVEFIRALQSVLITADVFLNESGELMPVLIDPGKFEIKSALVFLNQLKIGFKRSFKIGHYSTDYKRPTFKAIVACGVTRVNLDANNQNITTFGNLSFYKNGVFGATVTYNVSEKAYIFTSAQKEEGIYRFVVSLTLADGTVLNYDFNFNYRHSKAFIDTPQTGLVDYQTQCFSGTEDTWYIDWGVATADEVAVIADTITSVNETMYYDGDKRVTISSVCPDNVKLIRLNSNTKNFNLNCFQKLEQLYVVYNEAIDPIDLSVFKDLTTALIIGTDVDNIVLGFHKDMDNFNFSSNQLTTTAVENILLTIWKYRKFYKTATKYLYLGSNPGSGVDITATALAIINGTGAYEDEGLATDYSFSISY